MDAQRRQHVSVGRDGLEGAGLLHLCLSALLGLVASLSEGFGAARGADGVGGAGVGEAGDLDGDLGRHGSSVSCGPKSGLPHNK